MQLTTAPTPDKPGRWIVTEFGVPSVLKWEPFDSLPSPVNDQLLIRILVTGISGVDNMMRAGEYPHPRTSKPGFTPGHEFVGQVEAVGPEVSSSPHGNGHGSDLQVGSLVASLCFLGAYATHIILPASEVIKLQDHDDPVKIAALPMNFMTAYGMLTRSVGALPRGSSVLIGSVSGGVGTAVAQIARTFDLGLVLLGTCSPSKFDYVKSLGVIPISRYTPDLAASVKEKTGGEGVDVAFDAVGTEASIIANAAATKRETGHLVVISWMEAVAAKDRTGMEETGSSTYAALNNFITSGVVPRTKFWAVTWDYYNADKAVYFKDLGRVIDAVRVGKLEPVVGKLFRLSEAVEANELLVSGVGVRGKMEFVVDAELAAAHGL